MQGSGFRRILGLYRVYIGIMEKKLETIKAGLRVKVVGSRIKEQCPVEEVCSGVEGGALSFVHRVRGDRGVSVDSLRQSFTATLHF